MGQLGINLAEAVYFGSEVPFVNQANFLKRFVSSSNTVYTVNADGYPTNVTSGSGDIYTIIDMKAGHPNGTYTVTWTGPNNGITVGGGTNGPTSCTWTKNLAEQQLLLFIRENVTDIVIKHSSDAGNTNIFRDAFLEKLKHFSTIRFMDWQSTNYNGQPMNWATRRTPTSFTQARYDVAGQEGLGVCWDWCAELCNQTKATMWACVHHLSSDAYVAELAKLLHAILEPDRPLVIEHSNEVWNGQFPQYSFCEANGNPAITNNFSRALVYHVERTAAIGDIVKAHCPGRKVITTLGAWSAVHDPYITAFGLVSGPTLAKIDAIAIAPYGGGDVAGSDVARDAIIAGGVNEVFARLAATSTDYLTAMTTWRGICDTYGKQMLGYEGGQHITARQVDQNNTALTDVLVAASKDPRWYQWYLDYLDQWRTRSNGSLMCLFNSTYPPSKFGQWGFEEYEGQDIGTAHKKRAVLTWKARDHEPTITSPIYKPINNEIFDWEPNSLNFARRTGQSYFDMVVTDEAGVPVPANHGSVFVDKYMTPGQIATWTKRSGAKRVRIIGMSGGGGGGSGRKGAASTYAPGGGGGAGGAFYDVEFPASVLPSTLNVLVADNAAGGAAVTADNTNGNAGTAGLPTYFGRTSLGDAFEFQMTGGNAGAGATTAAGAGGEVASSTRGWPANLTGYSEGVAGAAGDGSAAAASGYAPGSGGGGGYVSAGNAAVAGGNGSSTGYSSGSGPALQLAGGTGGAAGVAGVSGRPQPLGSAGSGGGGGGGALSGAAGAGGNGGRYGAGGGGGGGARNGGGNSSGPGGNGAGGFLIVITEM